ncbi:hypothetical protein RFI_11335, partial [Reticulomyxa filosa]
MEEKKKSIELKYNDVLNHASAKENIATTIGTELRTYRYLASQCNHVNEITNPSLHTLNNKSKVDDLFQYFCHGDAMEMKLDESAEDKGPMAATAAAVTTKQKLSRQREYFLRSLLYPWCKCDSNTYLRELIHSQRYDTHKAGPEPTKSVSGVPLYPCELKIRVTMDLILELFCSDDTLTEPNSRKKAFVQLFQSSDGMKHRPSQLTQASTSTDRQADNAERLKREFLIVSVPVDNFGTMSVQSFFHSLIRCIANLVSGEGRPQQPSSGEATVPTHREVFLTDELLEMRFMKEDCSTFDRSRMSQGLLQPMDDDINSNATTAARASITVHNNDTGPNIY